MSNFGPPIETQSEKELLVIINNHDMRGGQIAMMELTRRKLDEVGKSITRLDQSIKDFNESADLYNKVLILVSIMLFLVAFVQLIVSVSTLSWWISTLVLIGTGALLIFVIRQFGRLTASKK